MFEATVISITIILVLIIKAHHNYVMAQIEKDRQEKLFKMGYDFGYDILKHHGINNRSIEILREQSCNSIFQQPTKDGILKSLREVTGDE